MGWHWISHTPENPSQWPCFVSHRDLQESTVSRAMHNIVPTHQPKVPKCSLSWASAQTLFYNRCYYFSHLLPEWLSWNKHPASWTREKGYLCSSNIPPTGSYHNPQQRSCRMLPHWLHWWHTSQAVAHHLAGKTDLQCHLGAPRSATALSGCC